MKKQIPVIGLLTAIYILFTAFPSIAADCDVADLYVDPHSANLIVGGNETFEAVAYDVDGNEVYEFDVTWRASGGIIKPLKNHSAKYDATVSGTFSVRASVLCPETNTFVDSFAHVFVADDSRR